MDDRGYVVEAGGSLGGEDSDNADDDDDADCNGVKVAIVLVESCSMDAEIIGIMVAEGGEIGRPRAGHGSTADYVLEQDVAGSNEGHEVPELYS